MISKELLSEVLTDNQQEFNVIGTDKNLLKYQWLNEVPFGDGDINCKWVDKEINIHELAFKCKEWAWENYRATLSSYIMDEENFCKIWWDGSMPIENDKLFKYNTEPEAIFKACQWILENHKI